MKGEALLLGTPTAVNHRSRPLGKSLGIYGTGKPTASSTNSQVAIRCLTVPRNASPIPRLRRSRVPSLRGSGPARVLQLAMQEAFDEHTGGFVAKISG